MKIVENDWHKAFHDRDLVATSKLSSDQRGVYYTLRNLVYREHGHIVNDDMFLAGWMKLAPRVFRRIRDELIAAGLIYVDATSLRVREADRVIEERLAKREKARKSGRLGGKARAANSGRKTRKRALENASPETPNRQSQLFEKQRNRSSDRLNSVAETAPDRQSGGRFDGRSADSTSRTDAPESSSANDLTEAIARNSLGESKSLRKEEVKKKIQDSIVDDDDASGLVASAIEEAVTIFNAIAGDGNDWPKTLPAIPPKRRRLLSTLFKNSAIGGLKGWRDMLARACRSDWLAGRVTRTGDHANWRASIDYFARVDVFFEVMEGKHDNDDRSRKTATGQANRPSRVGTALAGIAKARAG